MSNSEHERVLSGCPPAENHEVAAKYSPMEDDGPAARSVLLEDDSKRFRTWLKLKYLVGVSRRSVFLSNKFK